VKPLKLSFASGLRCGINHSLFPTLLPSTTPLLPTTNAHGPETITAFNPQHPGLHRLSNSSHPPYYLEPPSNSARATSIRPFKAAKCSAMQPREVSALTL
jgi:hypothetical protein